MNALHHQPSLELPSPKKSKNGEFVPGNNKFGSKGTIRCKKCQQRKGKCTFENPSAPCDYCFARGLECGPKLPTPRKLAEWGGLAMMQPIAIAQPLTARALSGQLNIQIPVTVSGGCGGAFNLSSANSDTEMPFAFPCPTQFGGRLPYSTQAEYASMNPGFTLPSPNYTVVQTWSSQQESLSPQTSPEFSSEMTSPEEFDAEDTIPVCPCIPARHPAHTLNASILPFVSSAIPNFPSTMAPNDQLTEEQLWELCQNWLELDDRPSTPAPMGISLPIRLRWNRLLSIPRSMRGRKLAGKWDDEKRVKTEEFEGIKSIKTAPSVLC